MTDTKVVAWLLDSQRPLRPPAPVWATIHRTKKTDYAVIASGRRFVIGTTAFLAEKPAHQRWQGNLDRMRKDTYLRFKMPEIQHRAAKLCTVNVYASKPKFKRKPTNPESSK